MAITSNGYVLDESARRLGELVPVPDAERHDRDALWERLRRDGYLFLRGALDPGVVDGFRRYYHATVAPSGVWNGAEDRAEYRRLLFREVVPGPEYAAFCAQPAVRDWYAWFLGAETFLHKRKLIRHVRPGESGVGTATQAHYDLVYLREGTDRVLSSWIPLGDCPVRRGGLTYLERSHHWVLARERAGTLRLPARSITADLPGLADEHDARWLVADYRAGDVVVHSAFTVHAALDNVDDDYRLSTDIRYQRAGDPIDWRWQQHWRDDDGL
ncbi:phytanoyl-CoA dioxygenase family protein [Jiangella anatolica]|uniref:Phytanoyl-CoA dioxygenase n=1 Tax=Jiangella anatolica TaxID=2670374 RepID=A0A2W2C6S7_9ACTN|nr:phytanoyl-CoA dioxygenase family protein [Jiangella anatolica]PZF83797.1 phytanoyl-CoA dioxygenase [Jiangella anatolica]